MAKQRQYDDVDRLCQDVYKSRLSLKRYRDEMRESVRQSVGRHWSEEGTNETVPLNLVSSYQSIISRKLVGQSPRVLLSTWDKSQKAAVKAMESWANREIENMQLASTLRRVVNSALFSVGITKVGLALPANSARVAWSLQVGSPYVEEVLLDDFVFDMHARSFDEVGYIGHRFRVRLDLIKDSKLYNGKIRGKLSPEPDPQFNREGDERIGVLGRSFYSNQEEYADFVDLWEFYLPLDRLIITLPDSMMNGPLGGGDYGGEPLRVVDWVGPDSGPYDLLCLGNTVPGNAMPSAPLQVLRDMHDAANNIWRKLIRQAQRQKQQLAYQRGADEDAERITKTSDGDAVGVDNPDKVLQLSWGGPNSEIFALVQKIKEEFSWQAGNLDVAGGLSPQSKTLGQDQLLAAASNGQLAAMQDAVLAHSRNVMKKLVWYQWNHPQKVYTTQWHAPGMPEYSITRHLHPASAAPYNPLRRTGRLADMDIRVDPYSMQGQTPQSQAMALDQMMQQIVIPMMPILQQQGVGIDIGWYLQNRGRLLDMPDLPEIIQSVQPPTPDSPSGPDQGQPGMPANTNRTYTRVSQGSQTQGNKDFTAMNRMAGGMGANERNGMVNR